MPVKKKNSTAKTKTDKSASRIKKKKSVDLTEPIVAINQAIDYQSPNKANFGPVTSGDYFLDSADSSLLAPKPPRALPLKNRPEGVNFAPPKKIVKQLSLINLFRLLFLPIIFLVKKLSQLQAKKFDDGEIEDVFARPKYRSLLGLKVPRRWYRPIAVFILAALVLIMPLQAFTYYQSLKATKNQVLTLSQDAINQLKSAQQSALQFDLGVAANQFDQAKQNFVLARQQINGLNWLSSEIIKLLPGVNNSVQTGVALLNAGESFAEVGQMLTSAGNNFLAQQGKDYYTALLQLNNEFGVIFEKFETAKTEVEKIDPSQIPREHQETFNQVISSLPTLEKRLSEVATLSDTLLKVLGRDQWQRYLLVFTNNNELRGVGGFMGSFALLDIDRGEIKKLEVPPGGTYDIQGQLVPKVISPAPLHLINPRWEFQDSNWWPNFPNSARKIEWFYENADGPSTDGVILMTAEMMSRLLLALGSVEMEDYGIIVEGQDFISTTQEIIRAERDEQSTKPKQFLADLAPKILEKLFSAQGSDLKNILAALQQGLNEKHLLFYFNDPEVQNIIGTLGWAGQIRETGGDYLLVVHTNLAGGKTDEVITQKIDHQAEIQKDGTIINTVTLTRSHNGIPGQDVFTGVQNNSYVRFYVPAGSSLISTQGFKKPDDKYFDQPGDELKKDIDLISIETDYHFDQTSGTDIYRESGKTVFGNWLQLKPGETQTATIKYRLPFKLAREAEADFYYSLLAQKQSGSLNTELTSRAVFADNYSLLAKFPDQLTQNNNTIIFSAPLITDQFYGIVLTSK